jgi:tetratricopeptide (TPR) repeat protein
MVEFRLLGPVEVWAGGRLVDVGQPRQRSVLAALLVDAGRLVTLEALVDRVWGERTPNGAHHALYSHVARVRRALAQASAADGTTVRLLRHSGGYLLDIDPDRVDLHRLRRLVEQARDPANEDTERLALLREALGLWRGEPLAGLAGAWAARVREAWRQLRLDAMLAWAQAELRVGDPSAVIGPLAEQAGEEPLVEPLTVMLMRALHAAGRSAEALDRYTATRRRLAEELGADPGIELQELHQSILRGDLDPLRASNAARAALPVDGVPAQLPSDVRGFTGRSRELSQLHQLLPSADRPQLGSTAVVISAIAGTAGIGKTALALHWAHQVRDRFPGGQLYVNLRGYGPTPPLDPLQALAQLLFGLGVEADRIPIDADRAAGLYRSLLAGRRALVVLDNARNAEQVRPLIPGAPGCVVLVTSRDRLGGLVASHSARRLSLNVLAPDEAVNLLERIIGEDRVRAEPEAATELAALCGLLPLALRIAAANLANHPDWPITGWLARLRAGDQLAELSVDGDPQAAVRTALDDSYATLDPDAQRLLRLLGLVPGAEFTAEAATALAGTRHEWARRLLDGLAAAHLVEQRGPARYGFHDLLRVYARQRGERDDSAPEREQALGRLLGWYLHTADRADTLLYPKMLRLPIPPPEGILPAPEFDEHAGALAWLDAERANLVAAVQHAAEHGPGPIAWLLADVLRNYFWGNRHMVDWLAVAGAGLAAAEVEGGPQAQAAVQRNLGLARYCLGDHVQAAEHHSSALALARRGDWVEGEAAALAALGIAQTETGELQQAADHHAQALALYRKIGSKGGQATGLCNLGSVMRQMGSLEQAANHITQSLALFRELGAPGGQEAALIGLGEINRDLGRLDAAREYLAQALVLARELGNRYIEVYGLHALAMVQRDAGRHPNALELAETALAMSREISELRLEAEALNTLGAIHLHLGRPERATDHHQRALDLARETNARYPETEALLGLGAAHQQQGQQTQAIQYAEQALKTARDAGFRILEGQTHTAMAAAHLDLGRSEQAVEHAEQALRLHRRSGHRLGHARTLVVLGQLLGRRDGAGAARSCWQEALALFSEVGSPDAQQVHALLGTLK